MQKKILMFAGEADEAYAQALEASGYACVRTRDERAALALAESERPSAAVLDAELLDKRDPERISALRAGGRFFPILALSPAGGCDALLALLNAGAEDYLTRPFEYRELLERIEVQLRRFGEAPKRGTLRHKALALDPNTLSVTLRDQPVRLTKQEFRILQLMLMSSPGRVFSKQDFFEYAWEGSRAGVDKTINVHICNIRRKFRQITEEPYIETIWGMGFRLV